jgi:hypothetical protein
LQAEYVEELLRKDCAKLLSDYIAGGFLAQPEGIDKQQQGQQDAAVTQQQASPKAASVSAAGTAVKAGI